jgi:hypothetical protein
MGKLQSRPRDVGSVPGLLHFQLEIDGPKHLYDGVEFRLNIIVFGKLRMNNLIQCIRHPFVKAFPGMRCSCCYFSMYVRRNP